MGHGPQQNVWVEEEELLLWGCKGNKKQIEKTVQVKYESKFSWLEALHFANARALQNKTASKFCWVNGLGQELISLQSSDYLLQGDTVNPWEIQA